jgi:hypothetical protein
LMPHRPYTSNGQTNSDLLPKRTNRLLLMQLLAILPHQTKNKKLLICLDELCRWRRILAKRPAVSCMYTNKPTHTTRENEANSITKKADHVPRCSAFVSLSWQNIKTNKNEREKKGKLMKNRKICCIATVRCITKGYYIYMKHLFSLYLLLPFSFFFFWLDSFDYLFFCLFALIILFSFAIRFIIVDGISFSLDSSTGKFWIGSRTKSTKEEEEPEKEFFLFLFEIHTLVFFPVRDSFHATLRPRPPPHPSDLCVSLG